MSATQSNDSPAKPNGEPAGEPNDDGGAPGSAYHHGNLRQALLDAVGEIIAEKGTGGVSLREAARRAGVSHGAPAHHFGDKLGMLTAFSARGYELFGARMTKAAETAGTPNEKITAVGFEYLRFAIEERAYFDVMFRDDMHDEADSHHRAVSRDAFSVLMGLAEQVATDSSGDEDPAILAIRAWSMVHGLATLWVDGALGHFWAADDLYPLAGRIFAAELG